MIKINDYGRNYSPFFFYLNNESTLPFNLTQGDYLTIHVSDLNTSSSSLGSVYSKITIVSSLKTTHLDIRNNNYFIRPSFNSFTDAEEYLYNSSIDSNTKINHQGSFLSFSSNLTSTKNETIHFSTSYNWKTGWLESIHNFGIFTNGSTAFDIIIQRHSSNTFFSTLFSYITSLFEIGLLFIFVAVIVIVVLGYNSYRKIPKTGDNSQSFTRYLRTKFFNRKQNNHSRTITTTSEALQTIETILEETNEFQQK